MRNLELLYQRNKIISNFGKAGQNVRFLVVDQMKPNLVYLYDDEKLFRYNLEENRLEELVSLKSVIAIYHLPVTNELSIATEGGDVFCYNLETYSLDVVTYCDGGITAMCWSPDQEIVVFITKGSKVVVMSASYDPIYETDLDSQVFGDREFINVGWGKKETQFHGSEGKQAAKRKLDLNSMSLLPDDNGQISITWRGDSELFAIHYVAIDHRKFKVYDKEGRLQFTSENCIGLGHLIAWKPSGSLIAVQQVTVNEKYMIALFEKNGLRHREIELPFSYNEEKVVGIHWSIDSDILAIESNRNGNSIIRLFVIGNYYWYRKQYLEFKCEISALEWDPNYSEPKTLHIMLSTGEYLIYRWDFAIHQSANKTSNDESMVAVIDGPNLFVTNFRSVVIPPPMYAHSLNLSNCNINFTGFLKSHSTGQSDNSFFVVDSLNTVYIFNTEFTKNAPTIRHISDFKRMGAYQIDKEELNVLPLQLRNWLWLTEDFFIFSHRVEKTTNIYLTKMIKELGKLSIIDKISIVDDIIQIIDIKSCSSKQPTNSVLIYTMKKSYHVVTVKDDKFDSPLLLQFKTPFLCEKTSALQVDENLIIFSLHHRNNLYRNGVKIASDVTSFFMIEPFVAYTTIDKLHFHHIADDRKVNDRAIENGGKLIAIVRDDSRTILQMPRGNLEAIQPRLLSICIFRYYMKNRLYKRAFDLLRKQRINLNLLVDNNPRQFWDDKEEFINQISNPTWLNLFLTELQNEDYSKTMYSDIYSMETVANEALTGYSAESKINIICDGLAIVLTGKERMQFILPMITIHVKQNNLEKALDLIWDLKNLPSTSVDKQENEARAKEALSYLLYLVDVNKLFNVAIGMYDKFDLALFVATKSQLDPKEYLPVLKDFKNLSGSYRKYKIDLYLKRYERALKNIIDVVRDDPNKYVECIDLIETHRLYSKALDFLNNNCENALYKAICFKYAEYLRLKQKLLEASYMYERADDFHQALLSAKHVTDWKRCLKLAKKLNMSHEDYDHLLNGLSASLVDSQNYKCAADLAILNGANYSKAISILIQGNLYTDAIYLAALGPTELSESLIKPHLVTYLEQLKASILADFDTFQKYKERLVLVRQLRTQKQEAADLEPGIQDFDDESISQWSSSTHTSMTGSQMTGKSRSSKNRRKHERKLFSLKEGSKFEDIALVDALYTLIHKIISEQTHIRSILCACIEFNLLSAAKIIKNEFKNLISIIVNSLDDIWIPEMMVAKDLSQMERNTIDFAQHQRDQHYAMIKPHQRYKPELKLIEWDFDLLQ